jgi:hypothetical protein
MWHVKKTLGLMILLACLKFCWCILNFAGVVFEIKVMPAKDPRQQNSAGMRQKIMSFRINCTGDFSIPSQRYFYWSPRM